MFRATELPGTRISSRRRRRRDRGNALPLTLVVGTVLSLVVVATANYTVTTLRYGQVAESRANTLAAANAAMDDAIEQLRLKRSLCATAAGMPASRPRSPRPSTIRSRPSRAG